MTVRFPRIVGHVRHSPAVSRGFVTPNYGAVLGDENPFSENDPRRDAWTLRREKATAEIAELYDRVLALLPERPSWAEELTCYKELYGGVFDIRARAFIDLLTPTNYSDVLAALTTHCLSFVEDQRTGIEQDLLPHLRALFTQRHAHWTAKALGVPTQGQVSQASSETSTDIAPGSREQHAALSTLVSVQKAAKHLGVSEDTVRRLQDRGQLARVNVGRLRRVPAADLRRLHAERTRR